MVGKHNFDPLYVILCPLEGQNWSNVAQNRIIPDHSSNKCTPHFLIGLCEYFFQIMVGNHHFDHFRSFFAQKRISSEHSPNKYIHQIWNWVINFPDNDRKPRADGRGARARTDGCSPFLYMAPPDSVRGGKNGASCNGTLEHLFPMFLTLLRLASSKSCTHLKS